MSLQAKINSDLKDAMRAKAEERLSTLRLLNAAIKNKAIEISLEKEKELEDGEIIKIIKTQIKQLKDALTDFEKAGRGDLVAKNNQEIETLANYLPEEMSEEAVAKIVEEKAAELGELTTKDFGKLMGLVMKEVGDQADGAVVKRLVQEKLASE